MVRGFAMILMLFYHYSQVIPGILPDDIRVTIFNEAIGAISLALFYTISGYGTYLLFDSNEQLKYKDFLKRRCLGIMPQYYFVWFTTFLLIKASAIGSYSLLDIGKELVFVQNYFPESVTMNGVAWTIALMMQFYLVAPLLYKVIKKRPYISVTVLLIAQVIIARTLCFYVTKMELSGVWLVAVSMRWLPSNIGVFAVGMFAAGQKKKLNCSNTVKFLIFVCCLCLMVAGFYKLVFYVGGTYGDGIRFVLREPVMGICAAFCLWLVAQLEFTYKKSIFGRAIQFVAKNEYGIYLWHMILFGCISGSAIYYSWYEKYPILILLVMWILAIFTGTISTKLTNSSDYRQLYKKILRIHE
jgi:peptidoglycan/LPS O-acetylase OafA/YrhL